jgi:hypothetical protein
MTGKNSTARNLIELVASTLGGPLTHATVDGLSASDPTLPALAQALEDFYRGYQIPRKRRGESRPYVFPPRVQWPAPLGKAYWTAAKSPPQPGAMARAVKTYLLYCHGLCIHDPLPYLLDYYRLAPDGQAAASTVPAIQAVLREYAKMSTLIEAGVLIPLSEEVTSFYKTPTLSPHQVRRLESRLAAVKEAALQVGEIIRTQQEEAARLEDAVDLLFPRPVWVEVYKVLLGAHPSRFTQRAWEPFYAGALAGVPAVDADRISSDDLLTMRQEDGRRLFKEWRRFLREVLRGMYTAQEWVSDREPDLHSAVEERLEAGWYKRLQTRAEGPGAAALHHHLSALGA